MKAFFSRVLLLCLLSIPLSVQAQSSQTYTVKPGDTLFSIAQAHNISIEDLRRLNSLEGGAIRSGMKLIISDEVTATDVLQKAAISDKKEVRSASDVSPKAEELKTGVDLAASGETVASVADKLEMSVDELLMLNSKIEDVVDRLNEISPTEETTSNPYVVKPGETLFSIARSHGMTVRQLSDFNSMAKTSIQSGQKIRVPGNKPAGTSVWVSMGEIDAVMYPSTFVGRTMASGIIYDEVIYAVGHATLPIGTLIMLGKAKEGPTILCIVTDDSLSVSMNVIDVSAAVASAVGLQENDRVEVYTLK